MEAGAKGSGRAGRRPCDRRLLPGRRDGESGRAGGGDFAAGKCESPLLRPAGTPGRAHARHAGADQGRRPERDHPGPRGPHRLAGGIHAALRLQPREPCASRLPRRGAPREPRRRGQAPARPARGGDVVNATADSPNAIDVRGLTKSFNGRKVVDDFSMQVRRGLIYGFLGPNGSGKTTTIRMLCGLLTPDAGEGTCIGLDLRRDAALIKRQVGYMTQKFSLYEDLSIQENLEFIAHVYEVPDRRRRVAETLESLGLTGRRAQPAGSLSGGWKQRLALAACLIHDPKLLLLDEPTAGVDPKARRDFWDHLHHLAAGGMTVLVSTHYMDEAERCHALAYIAYGKLVTRGTSEEIVREAGLSIYAVTGPNLAEVADRLRGAAGVELVIPFGSALHLGGIDRAAVAAAVAPLAARPDTHVAPIPTALEHVFIRLMDQASDNFATP
ncbi:MAG: ATP-binding cassette domain-containing protein [Verrucomicrobia bacterium]|nr:ATP-binding cassette domain-containing protein [Verrucomicrobiota bacterium]